MQRSRSVAGLVHIVLLFAVSRGVDAQSLPAPWVSADVGAPTLAGSASHASGVFTIDGAGRDIWGTSDQFQFVYQQVSGDVEVVARVRSVSNQHEWSKAGVMIRATLAANSAHAYSVVSAARGVHFQRRPSAGAVSSSTSASTVLPPAWIKAVRTGNTVTTYWSATGSSWTTIGSVALPLGASAYVGIAVTSHNTGARTTAAVSDVAVVRKGLPAGQQSVDIGAPAIAGTASYSAGRYTIKAGGVDIWGTSDQFHFVYQPITGDAEVIARVGSLTSANAWSKAGIMIREALTAQSRHASMFASVSKGYAFQRRPDTGGWSVHTSGGSGAPPGWVRLRRTGDRFDAYRSADGVSWTTIGSDTIPMADTVYVGLAVTSHNTTTATTAVMDSLKITAATPSPNRPPAVSVTAPVNGSQVAAGTAVAIAATATDPENRMMSVEFYAGSTLIARDMTAPYSTTWTPATGGSYALTATAYDQDGGSSTSGAVTVTVTTPNRPPTVALSVGAGPFVAPASVPLTATASDPEGHLARVEFISGTTRLATDTTAPYSYTWLNVAAGSYSLRAVAYDASGASANSATVTVVVSGTTTSPPKSVVFGASADHATNVTSYLLEVFAATANPATASPVATSTLGKPTPAANNDITVDRSSFFTALAPGTYVATVSAIGPGGRTRSTAVTFSR